FLDIAQKIMMIHFNKSDEPSFVRHRKYVAVLASCIRPQTLERSHLITYLESRSRGEGRQFFASMRIPMNPAMHSNIKPATCSDLKAATVPI
ncbi:MAG: hypothetical protein WA791_22745, partial [Rhodomicrobium sp.]